MGRRFICLKWATTDETEDALHQQTNFRNTMLAGEWLLIARIDTLEGTLKCYPGQIFNSLSHDTASLTYSPFLYKYDPRTQPGDVEHFYIETVS